jgi:GNAT superfamily N-acetyltransferase
MTRMSEATTATATATPIEIEDAEFPRDLPTVRALFLEYAAGVGVDLCFQGFEAEVATLPGRYAPPGGRLLLAWRGTQRGANAVGCVALRELDERRCEMKRLYVREDVRGHRLGRQLVERICDVARAIGYARLCLDTLPSMSAARGLYRALGFRPVAPYVFNPIAGAEYLALDL